MYIFYILKILYKIYKDILLNLYIIKDKYKYNFNIKI